MTSDIILAGLLQVVTPLLKGDVMFSPEATKMHLADCADPGVAQRQTSNIVPIDSNHSIYPLDSAVYTVKHKDRLSLFVHPLVTDESDAKHFMSQIVFPDETLTIGMISSGSLTADDPVATPGYDIMLTV